MLAQIEYPTYELIELAKQARGDIHAIEGVFFWIAIPLALLPPVPLKWKWIWIRTLVITVVVWIATMEFRIAFEVPWNRAVMNIEQRDPGYDGVGGNAALLLFGWVLPFIQCIVTLSLARVGLNSLRARRNRKAEQDADDQAAAAVK
jgi:hypothetical protein